MLIGLGSAKSLAFKSGSAAGVFAAAGRAG